MKLSLIWNYNSTNGDDYPKKVCGKLECGMVWLATTQSNRLPVWFEY